MNGIRRTSNFASIATATLCVVALVLPANVSNAQSGRNPAPARNGMVVSSHYLASEVGMEVLRQGGNAIDATVATAMALAVTLPSAGNIGGGGFIVYHGADGTVTSFNFREKAPAAATRTMFLGDDGEIQNDSNHEGLLSVGVPGTVAGLALAHERLGSMKWSSLVQPSVDLARKGFPSTWAMQGFLHRLMSNPDAFPTTNAAFLKNGREMYEPGELFKQPDLAATLDRIKKNGRDGFYKGKTADLLADFMSENGGLITREDLANYQAEELKPVHGTYDGYDIYVMPPPSSGGVALIEMLNILEPYPLKELGHNSANYLHLLTEAMRRAYSDRAQFIGDPNFNPDMPVQRLISKAHADELRKSISPYAASVSDSARFNMAYESEETTHFSVVDAEGNMVSMTYTLEYSYGSRITVPGAGFLLNNEMGDFNPIPGRTTSTGLIGTLPNQVEPNKRMLSSMTPTIVARDGKPLLAVGSPGGKTIINTVLQVVLNVLEFDMNVAQAVEAPRIHHQWLPDVTSFESFGFSSDTMKLYEAFGHRTRTRGSQGSAMAIYVDQVEKLLLGAADSRSFDGRAVGF